MRTNHLGSLLIGLVVLAGCTASTSAPERSAELQLNWIPDAQHGGFLAAERILREAEPPFQLAVRPGGPGTPVLPHLAMGRVDFAVANADQVLLARSQGADVVAVFAALQHSPRCIMVHADSDVVRLVDLHDVSLAMGEGKAYAEFLKARTDWKNVRIVAYTGSVARFLTEDNFAQQAYSFSEPLVVAARGVKARCLMVSELGFNPYTSLLVTRAELIQSNPDRVRTVVNAVREGWRHYLAEPAEVHRELQRLNPDMDVTVLDQSVGVVRSLCLPDDMDPSTIGTMSAERWTVLAEQLAELGLLEKTVNATDAFTVEFLR